MQTDVVARTSRSPSIAEVELHDRVVPAIEGAPRPAAGNPEGVR